MKNFIEVFKTNKKAIFKKGLIVMGTVVGLAIVNTLTNSKDEDESGEEFDNAEENESENFPEDE